MKATIPPSEAETYGLDRTDYHSVLMESGLHNGRILQIQRRTPYEVYVLIEGRISDKLDIQVQRLMQVIQHEDGLTNDYIAGSILFIEPIGTQQQKI